jgi:molybdopterin-containing oxidoreductase family membrane subunit
VILIVLAVLRRSERLEIKDQAMWKIGELMAYAMFVYLFLLGAEFFREAYSSTEHALFNDYVFRGLGPHQALVPFAWLSLALCLGAFFLFLIPRTRKHPVTLIVAAVMAFLGVYVEKGNVLVIAGFTPSTLGEVYEYAPSRVEIMVTLGVYGAGALIYTFLLKVAVPILEGHFQVATLAPAEPGEAPPPEPTPAVEPPPAPGSPAGEGPPGARASRAAGAAGAAAGTGGAVGVVDAGGGAPAEVLEAGGARSEMKEG